MASDTALLTTWSYGLAGLVYTLFALSLIGRRYLARPREAPRVALVAALVASAAWGWALLAGLVLDPQLVLQVGFAADAVRYGAWFVFLLVVLKGQGDGSQGLSRTSLAALAALGLGVAAALQAAQALRWEWEAALARPVLYSALALPVLAMVLLEQLFRNVSDDARWSLKPLTLGLAGAFLFDIYLYSQGVLFNRLDEDAFSIRGAVHALVVPLLLVSTSRQADWISRIQISRKAAFHSATLVMAGLYLLFVSGVGYYVRFFGGDWGRALQLGLVFVALVMLVVVTVSGAVRARLRVFLGKHFFRYRYDYREEWLRFTQTLSSGKSPQEMGPQVVRGLADMLESPGGALWLRERGSGPFRQSARWNMAASDQPEPEDSPLAGFLRDSGWVVNLEEFRSFPRRYGHLQIPRWLQELPHAWLIVPLGAGDAMIGFVVLARARARVDVNWEVNDLLKTAGRQAAAFLSQMQATEALLEVRKFDAFNRMSAFVVHDLKNIVTQLSLMLKNAQRLRNNPEFQEDMLMTVENSLDRMRQLMAQLREGATPPGTLVGVDLQPIAERIAKVVRDRGRMLELDIPVAVATRGHAERIERIIGHMVQNAFDATEPGGRVWLRLDREGGQALIEVGDTGHGMSDDFVRNQLFKPFQTTKSAGMGIGAYESSQYVQELGGRIQVRSEVGRGTVITILLPLFEVQRHSDLQPLGDS